MKVYLRSDLIDWQSSTQAFIGPDITFAVKPYFRGPFCADDVRQGLIVDFIHHILNTAKVSGPFRDAVGVGEGRVGRTTLTGEMWC